ncbi:MAG TPA: cupin domain-containing protein [Lichenihabitans sp.]|nr:cupin domain-containing protein [Lichenihabitans sp.]
MAKIGIQSATRTLGSDYPAPFDEPCRARLRFALGDVAGLTQFGVNLQRLQPGGWSSLRHWHTAEDEFVWVVRGEVVLVTDVGEEILRPAIARDSRPVRAMATISRTARTTKPCCSRSDPAGPKRTRSPTRTSTCIGAKRQASSGRTGFPDPHEHGNKGGTSTWPRVTICAGWLCRSTASSRRRIRPGGVQGGTDLRHLGCRQPDGLTA